MPADDHALDGHDRSETDARHARPPGAAARGGDESAFEPPPWRDRLELIVTGGASAIGGRARWLATGGVALVALVVAAVVVLRPAPAPPELSIPVAGSPGDPSAVTSPTTSPAVDAVVHAAGAVRHPGVYRLSPGARVADLVAAAGGPLPEADLDRVNLAAAVADGAHVYVPRRGEPARVPVTDGGRARGADGGHASGPVNLNTATEADLESLPGVGPATARAIIDERERRGGFRAVEELLEVRGIGDARLAALRDLVVV